MYDIYAYVYMNSCVCVCVCVHISVYVCICTHTYIHACIHTAHLDAAALDEKLTDRVVGGDGRQAQRRMPASTHVLARLECDGRQAQRRVPATAEAVVVVDVVVDGGGGGVPLGGEDGEQQFAHD